MKVLSIVGARPQFVKAGVVSNSLDKLGIQEILVHTGQHYDYNMSDVFFKDLNIKAPMYNLEVGSDTHGAQTGKMLIEIEKVLLKEGPDLVLVYGDTNTTLAGALAAAKLKIKVGHIESGLRSYNKNMPEEINRVLTDHLSDLLFAPTRISVENLKKEGIKQNVFFVGDVMFDVAIETMKRIKENESKILSKYNLEKDNYILVTIHREENTNIELNLRNIVDALLELSRKGLRLIFPIHPRTRKYLMKYDLLDNMDDDNLTVCKPVPYSEMIILESNAKLVITDSGGVQKESYFFKTPSIIPRNETEWVELVDAGWNIVVGHSKENIVNAVLEKWVVPIQKEWLPFYGEGKASENIAGIIKEIFV